MTVAGVVGWAAGVKYHEKVRRQFREFYKRSDTFSLGVCNGCQLMTLLGWVGEDADAASGKCDIMCVILVILVKARTHSALLLRI